MNRDKLKAILTSMAVTAEVVEAIGDPALQSRRGWDLRGWNYVLVPWGVRFTHSAFAEEIDVRIAVFPERRGKRGECELMARAFFTKPGRKGNTIEFERKPCE